MGTKDVFSEAMLLKNLLSFILSVIPVCKLWLIFTYNYDMHKYLYYSFTYFFLSNFCNKLYLSCVSMKYEENEYIEKLRTNFYIVYN